MLTRDYPVWCVASAAEAYTLRVIDYIVYSLCAPNINVRFVVDRFHVRGSDFFRWQMRKKYLDTMSLMNRSVCAKNNPP